jgi:DNA-directed RNA polymerase II subunit RPB1
VSDRDARLLGLDPRHARPEWLLLTVLPVPPPHVRPSVQLGDSNQRSEDDLTHQLVNIVKANRTLEQLCRAGEAPHIVSQFEELLQYKVNALFDNEANAKDGVQEKQRGGKPLKTIRQRLKGKEGRIRGNLMGKRVDFSARTVITADPNLSVDQVGVPRSIAKTLTVPERVAPYNVHELSALVRNGPEVWPGARYVVHADGRRVDLRFVKHLNDLALHTGFVVERHLRDDDLIVFNRQPSLHKMSIMAHRVKVLDHSTFRLNLSVTSPYNADFDGDEMNLCAAASVEATPNMIVACSTARGDGVRGSTRLYDPRAVAANARRPHGHAIAADAAAAPRASPLFPQQARPAVGRRESGTRADHDGAEEYCLSPIQ